MRRWRYGCGHGRDYPTHGCSNCRASHGTANSGPYGNRAYTIAYSCRYGSSVDAGCGADNRSRYARAVHTDPSCRDKGCADCSADAGGGRYARAIHTGGDGCGYACNDGGNDHTRGSCRNAATRATANPNGSATTHG